MAERTLEPLGVADLFSYLHGHCGGKQVWTVRRRARRNPNCDADDEEAPPAPWCYWEASQAPCDLDGVEDLAHFKEEAAPREMLNPCRGRCGEAATAAALQRAARFDFLSLSFLF